MSWFQDIFGFGNPSKDAMKYIGKIPGQTNQYMQPYFNAGTAALDPLSQQYSQLMSDPSKIMNQIGASYQQSPGFKAAMEQALQAGGHAAAAGGMAGTPSHEYQNMKMATDLANQDYGNYMQNALGLYGAGLSGQSDLAHMGQQSGQSMADMIAQALASQAGYSYAGKAGQNQAINSLWGNLFGAGGAIAGGLMNRAPPAPNKLPHKLLIT